MSDLNFKIAYELTIMEFCAICQKQGLSLEETKVKILENAKVIAARMKEIQE